MKVQRYLYGRTNVSQLESGRAALRSPAEVAAEAAAPYQAGAEIGKAISDGLFREEERQQKIQDKQDVVQLKMMDEQVKLLGVQMKNDPRYKDQVQSDGTMTGTKILEDYEKGIAEIQTGFGEIANPTTRANAEKLFEMTKEAGRLETRTMVNDLGEAWLAKSAFEFRNLMIEAGDFTGAREQTQELLNSGLITQEQSETDINQIRTKEIDQESTLVLEAFEGSENKDAFYERLATNDTLDPDVKKSAISKVENHIGNLSRIRKKKAQVAHVAVLQDMTNMEAAIKSGKPVPMSIQDFVQSGMGYSPELDIQMMKYGKQLTLAKITGAKSAGAYTEFAAQRLGPDILKNTSANQKHLDTEMEGGYTPDMTDEQKEAADVAVMLDAKFLSAKWEERFTTSVTDSKRLGELAPVWAELMLNNDINSDVQTDVPEDVAVQLTNAAKAIKSEVDPTVAGQNAIDMEKAWRKDEPEMSARQNNYTQKPPYGDKSISKGKRQALNAFNALIDDTMDNSPKLFFGFTDPGQAEFRGTSPEAIEDMRDTAFANYEAYFFDAYMRAPDFESAAATANMMFSQNYNMNNVNGEWQIEKNGAKGDQSWRLETFTTEHATEEVIYGSDGTRKSKLSEIGDITFQNPYKVGDELRYEVWGPEGPIQQDVVAKGPDGKPTVDRQIVYESFTDEAAETKKIQEAREATKEEIKGYQDEYDAAVKAESFGSLYGRKETQATLRDTANKIKAEKRKLKDKETNIKGQPGFN